jgi:uncharacterized membrane protein YhaH (DUF805 family)
VNYYLAAFRKYAVFNGRATRSEYWYFTLFNIFAVLGFCLIDQFMGTFNFDAGYGPLSAIYTLAMILPGLGVSIRRLHDTGRSGWWFLIKKRDKPRSFRSRKDSAATISGLLHYTEAM